MKLLSGLLLMLSLLAVGSGFATWQQRANPAAMPEIAAIMAPACLTHAGDAREVAPVAAGSGERIAGLNPR